MGKTRLASPYRIRTAASILWLAATVALSVVPWAGRTAFARPPSPWGQFKMPAPGTPAAIGGYSSGCLRGGVALAMDGCGYQVMHPSRLRHFGHPELVSFITDLGTSANAAGLGPLMIGDLSQPRGGRASGGHASHQSGLDVDIWFWHPKQAKRGPLTQQQRENIKARSVLNGRRGVVRKAWYGQVKGALQIAATDPRTARIFVNPVIKRELCARVEGERGWLRKVRPWYGHDDHFHVRLHCPSGNTECEPQAAIAAGDGCDQLDFWFDAAAQRQRKKARSRYRRKVVTESPWPDACQALLSDASAPPAPESTAP